jgi:hypothetical protein
VYRVIQRINQCRQAICRENLLSLRGLARVGFLMGRHETHQSHKAPDAPTIHQMPLIAQMTRHFTHSLKQSFQERLINHAHQVEVHLALTLWLIVK